MQTFQISDAISQKFDVIAHKMHQSKEMCINKALEDFLEDQEDYFLALSRWENLQKGESQTYSMEEVARSLNLPLP